MLKLAIADLKYWKSLLAAYLKFWNKLALIKNVISINLHAWIPVPINILSFGVWTRIK